MRKILFLHGFFASGQCVPALALREYFEGKAEVIAPDLPTNPYDALSTIRGLCDEERPDLIVGNSCGAFYAQMVASERGMPALLGNPYFRMTAFLKERKGRHRYKSARRDGREEFEITDNLIEAFDEIEERQFDHYREEDRDRIWGLFGDNDPIAHFEPLFLKYYSRSFHFPGAHTPTSEEVKGYYGPLAERMMGVES